MRPLRLLLDGFGSYRQPTEADFSDVDFFVLTGPTGAGKSTVIDGICFALYGTVPRWGSQAAIAQALAPAASACRVGLVFETGGKRYAAVRALARDKRGQVHTREARLDLLDPSVPPEAPLTQILEAAVDHLAEGPDQVKAKVQDILGLTYEHFTQSVLLPQGRFSDFLQAEPRKRQDLLVELLAFGVYEKVGQLARQRAERAADRSQTAQRELTGLKGATREAEERAAARVQELEQLGATVDERLDALTLTADQARQTGQQAEAAHAETSLLAAIRVPGGASDLSDRITRADQLVTVRKQAADKAAQALEEAERVRDHLPDRQQAEAFRNSYDHRRSVAGELEHLQQKLAARLDAERACAAELEAAQLAAERALAARDAAQQAHVAYLLAELLEPGQDCPVCLQPVTELPHHSAPPGVGEARATAKAAEAALERARNAHVAAGHDTAAARARLERSQEQLDQVAATLADAPGEGEVGSVLALITEADERLRAAREEARARGKELHASETDRAAQQSKEQSAWEELRRSRDSVVALGAPAIAERDLAAAWSALAGWARAQQAEHGRRLDALESSAAALREQAGAARTALLRLLAEHGVSGVAEPGRAPAAVAEHLARSRSELALLHRDRERAARLEQEVATLREEQQVATELGRLLRATSFERWLCSEALDSLVAEASATLMELSGDQYQLDRNDRNELVVIDYEDAGAQRPVHTLSGGETFQASLALALALSRQVVGLSAGMRNLQSMFLDEGFGTLDEETLDTVASTLERLALDKDRMVGLITHVPALAERVPVRFVVSRDGSGSSLVKERA
jgi:DNA repair protein SbcC/Rad50